MKSPIEFSTVFGEVFLDVQDDIILPCGDISSRHIRYIEFQYKGRLSGKNCFLVRFAGLQFEKDIVELLREELMHLASLEQEAHELSRFDEFAEAGYAANML